MERKGSVLKKPLAVVLAVIALAVAVFAAFLSVNYVRVRNISAYDWALQTIKENYYFDFDENGVEEQTPEALAARLDRYSQYYTAEEYKEVQSSNSGVRSGIGVTYEFIPDKGVLLRTVTGNSPALKSGLRAGDVLTGATYGGSFTEFSAQNDFADFIAGLPDGERFTLNTEEGEFTLCKEVYRASYTCMYTNKSEWGFTSENNGNLTLYNRLSNTMNFLPDGAAYIGLSQFYGTAAGELELLFKNFNANACTSLILDLRNNGGGYVSVMQDIAGYFVSSVTEETSVAMTAEYKNGNKEIYNCYRHSGEALVPAGTEVYVLANSGTASASEALMGVLVSYGILKYQNIFLSEYSEEYLDWIGATGGERAARSYGKGIMQTTFTKRYTGEALKLTTAQIYWPNGKCIHGTGLTVADGCRTSKADWVVTKDDAELKGVISAIAG